MLSRATVPVIALLCVLLVGTVSVLVQLNFHQDQVAADAAIQQDALALAALLADLPGAEQAPPVANEPKHLRDALTADAAKPFDDRLPLYWHEYEWRWDGPKRLLLGRPKFYGRGFWLSVAVIVDQQRREHFYVNDAGGRWGVDAADLAFGPDWHEFIH